MSEVLKKGWKEYSISSRPSKTGRYLVYYPSTLVNKISIADFNSNNNAWHCVDLNSVGEVSHWCELPDEPFMENH